MVRTRRSEAATKLNPATSPKPSSPRVRRHSLCETGKLEKLPSTADVDMMDLSGNAECSKQQITPGQKSPKTDSRRTRKMSQSESRLDQPPKDPAAPQRRRSSSESRQKRSVDSQPEHFHTYRMHRIKFFDYEPQAINCIACDRARNRLALSRSDGSVEIWTVGGTFIDLYQQAILSNEVGTSIEALLWHNGILYRGGVDGDLVEYDMTTYRSKKCIPGHAGAIWCLALNKDETLIAAGTEEGCVVLFLYTGEGFEYMKSLQKQEERMMSIDWHESGDIIVTGGLDNIRLWSVDSGNALQRITIARQSPDKSTIVWSVAILKDMTIVSGDSRGKVTFWNGKHGTQLKMFSCHRADIFSIAVNDDENQVYAAGIDPVLIQFELTPVNASSDWLVWQRASVRAHHTHDVRAVVMMNNFVITGGVDCSLVAVNFEEKLKYKTIPLPHHSLVHVAKKARLVLLQYSSHVHLWTLGATHTTLPLADKSKNMLALSSRPVNLLELRSRKEEHIVCSDISSDGTWVAYCDRNSLRLFNLTMGDNEILPPKISASRLRGLPTTLSHLPIRCIKFSIDNSLYLGYIDGSVKCVQLKVTNSLPHIHNIISSTTSEKDISLGTLHQMVVSPDGSKVATSDSNYNTLVYVVHEDSLKLTWRLPREDMLVTALAFSPNSECLAYALSSHKVIEYNLMKRCYSRPTISSPTHKSRKSHYLSVVAKVLNMQYSSHDPTIILLHDALGVRTYSTKSGTIGSKRNMYPNRYLMHYEELDEDYAVVVERSPLALSSVLPQALAKKQFGS